MTWTMIITAVIAITIAVALAIEFHRSIARAVTRIAQAVAALVATLAGLLLLAHLIGWVAPASVLAESLSVADEMGVRRDVDKLMAQRVADFFSGLLMRGLDVMVSELGDALASADASWRTAHPDLAAQFPKDQV